jgi:hypothetical protein
VDGAAHPVRAIDDRDDRRVGGRLYRVGVFGGRRAQGAGGAAGDDSGDRIRWSAVEVDERFYVGAEHRGQPFGALPEVGAAAAIVEHGDAVGDVGVAAVDDRAIVGGLGPVEAFHAMGYVTERLVARSATTTQTPRPTVAQERPLGVVDGHLALHPIRAVLGDEDRGGFHAVLVLVSGPVVKLQGPRS